MGDPLHDFLAAACLPCPPQRSPAEHLLALVSEPLTLSTLLDTRTKQLTQLVQGTATSGAQFSGVPATDGAAPTEQQGGGAHRNGGGSGRATPASNTPSVSRRGTPNPVLPALLVAALPGAQLMGGQEPASGGNGKGEIVSRKGTPVSRKGTSSGMGGASALSLASQLAAAVVQAQQSPRGVPPPGALPFGSSSFGAGAAGGMGLGPGTEDGAGPSGIASASKKSVSVSIPGGGSTTVLMPPEGAQPSRCTRWLESIPHYTNFRDTCSQRARELSVLAWRAGVEMGRNPTLLLLHCLLAVGAGTVVGLIFFQQPMTLPGEGAPWPCCSDVRGSRLRGHRRALA